MAALLWLALGAGDRLSVTARAADESGAGGIFQFVKRFDFNERPLGNFEATPMHWTQLSGPGLPRYSRGKFDEELGRSDPPSFVFHLRGGSICYEYQYDDLTVLPDADYLVVAYVRASGLRHAQVFVQTYMVDRLGRRVPEADHLSRLVGATLPGAPDAPEPGPSVPTTTRNVTDATADDESWQRLEVAITGEFPTAHALRLRLWVLQSQVWEPADELAIDPIPHQDVRATVWFDDITVYRLPRARLRLSDPGGIVRPGAGGALVLDVRNPASVALTTSLTIVSSEGEELFRERRDVPAHAATPLRIPLPPLEPGLYDARLWLQNEQESLLYRAIRFAVLPELPPAREPMHDFGVDLGLWRRGDVAGVAGLLRELRCGCAKIAVPMVGSLDEPSKLAYFDQVRELARELIGNRIDTTGVILTRSAATEVEHPQSTRHMMTAEPGCERRFGPVLAHLSGLLAGWQLGDEQVELAAPGAWTGPELAELRRKLDRFIVAPKLVVPYSVFDPQWARNDLRAAAVPGTVRGPGSPDAVSIWVPGDLPASLFARQLAPLSLGSSDDAGGSPGLAPGPGTGRWVRLGPEPAGLTRAQRLADRVQRVVLAKTLGAERVYVPAPCELSAYGGHVAWQPTEEYIVLRTLFHYLSGKRAVAAQPLPDHDGMAIIFADSDSTSMVLWTWRQRPPDSPVELYLGSNPVAIDLRGRRTPLTLRKRRSQIQLAPLPIIVDDIDGPLALLQASFGIEPTFVQLHQPEPRPVLHLRNYYAGDLAGLISFTVPEDWRLAPQGFNFNLPFGQTLAHTLHLELPPRETTTQRSLGVRVSISRPVSEVLEFDVPIRVGLRDIRLTVETRWSEADLVVTHSLQNLSTEPVNFNAFCRAPGRAQIDRAFLNVSPGEVQTRTYRYRNARDLKGTLLRLGVREIQGRRTRDQLVEILD